MAGFDSHEKCACCRDKKVGDDSCVKGQDCLICEGFTDGQRETLSTPSYKICKEKRAGSLVYPKDVTRLLSVLLIWKDKRPLNLLRRYLRTQLLPLLALPLQCLLSLQPNLRP